MREDSFKCNHCDPKELIWIICNAALRFYEPIETPEDKNKVDDETNEGADYQDGILVDHKLQLPRIQQLY